MVIAYILSINLPNNACEAPVMDITFQFGFWANIEVQTRRKAGLLLSKKNIKIQVYVDYVK